MTTALIRALRRVLPARRVLTRPADLLCYALDATADDEGHLPDVVVLPESAGEAEGVVRVARETGTPIYPRGAGTSLSGGAIPARGGIVLSTAAMDAVLEVDAANHSATVQPGVVLQRLDDLAAERGLMYPPDPGSVAVATVGGSIAECAGGLRGLKYGVTKHYVTGLEVVLATGERLRLGGKTTKNATGYDLVGLFVGSEGTLGVITEATLRLVPRPEARATLSSTFSATLDATRTVAAIVAGGVVPATLEFLDATSLRMIEEYTHAGLPLDAAAMLLVELDGPREAVAREAELVAAVCREHGGSVERAADDAARSSKTPPCRAAASRRCSRRSKPSPTATSWSSPRSVMPVTATCTRRCSSTPTTPR